MRVLIVGNGQGSWAMRGHQMGAALGRAGLDVRVATDPSEADFDATDAVILIKRYGLRWLEHARRRQLPILFDVLDSWQQPAQNSLSPAAALAWLSQLLQTVRPTLAIGATKAMSDACDRTCDSVYLPHHTWQGLLPTPPRRVMQAVGYQGNPLYLGRWHGWITKACADRGWRFVVNPGELSAVDLVVALREGPWDGWMCRQWKSGVKIGNAIAAGRPVITQDTAAMAELQAPGMTIATAADLETAFDRWASWEARYLAWIDCERLAPALRVDAIAATYAAVLETLRVKAVA